LLEQLPLEWRQCTAAIAVAGTTTTSLLVDRRDGSILADPILYNEPQGQNVVSAAEVSYVWLKVLRNHVNRLTNQNTHIWYALRIFVGCLPPLSMLSIWQLRQADIIDPQFLDHLDFAHIVP